MIPVWHFLTVGAVLFGIGMVGFLTRRNLITMFLCAELMLQGVVLNLVAFSRYHGNMGGQVLALFVITVAACESALALALFLTVYRRGKSLDAADWQSVREAGLPPTVEAEPLPLPEPEPKYPTLPAAGTRPVEEEPARV